MNVDKYQEELMGELDKQTLSFTVVAEGLVAKSC